MAGPSICHSLCQNSLSVEPVGEPLTDVSGPAGRNSTFDSKTFSGLIDPFCAFTPVAFIPALFSTEKLFKQFVKIFMESVQNPGLIHTKPQKQLFKARFLNLYFGKSHMDFYYFCHQCENHFDTAWANGSNHTSFAALFFYESISFQWT